MGGRVLHLHLAARRLSAREGVNIEHKLVFLAIALAR
jgi:hypothetical protein